MATDARIGHGTLVAILDQTVSPPTFVNVAEITNVAPFSLSRDAVDATHSESPEKWREYIPGLRDAGETTFEMNFNAKGSGVVQMLGSFSSDSVQTVRITFPDATPDVSPSDATVWESSGFITNYAIETPIDDKMTASVTIKLSGKPTFLEG